MFERTLTPLERRQVLQRHRLEGRLGDRPGRAGGRRAGRQAVADVHLRRAAAAGGRHGPRRRAGLAPRALAGDLQERRDLLCDGLAALGLDVRRPEGTYFALTDISSLGWQDGMEFCLALPERAGVVAIPTQPFHDSRRRRPARALGVLQGGGRDRGGAGSAWPAADLSG